MNMKMEPMELRKNILNFLKEHKSGSLATCKDNVPRSSPVQYFLGENMDIFILSAGGDKFEAIHNNPNVCLLVNTEYINYRKIKGVQIFGKVTTSLEDNTLFDEAKIYSPDIHLIEQERNSIKIIKIVPSEIVYLDSLEEGNRTKQIYKDNNVTLKEEKELAQNF